MALQQAHRPSRMSDNDESLLWSLESSLRDQISVARSRNEATPVSVYPLTAQAVRELNRRPGD